MKTLIEYFVRRGTLANALTIAVVILGLFAVTTLQREIFPNVSFEVISIQTPFPGASPEEVEKLITNPIEQALKEVDGIKKLTSVSTESISLVLAQLDPDQTTENDAKVDIQDAIDKITNFPEDAEESLIAIAESKNQPIIEVSISGDLPEIELRQIAKDLEDHLERIRGIAFIRITGLRELEIRVDADPKKLARYRISLDDLILALRNQNRSIPGGVIEAPEGSDQAEVILRTAGDYENVEGVKNTIVRANDLGQVVRVSDIAEVSYGLEKTSIYTRTRGKPSLNLTIARKQSADAITVVDKVKKRIEELKPGLADGVGIEYVNDLSYYIRRRIKILTGNLAIGLCFVLMILALILPMRVALITAIGIPFAFLGTMFLFSGLDISINLISLMGLIIVVGMLVDDAIVVTDNCVRRIENGEDPKEAAIRGTQEIWVPVTVSVFTTILAFAPLMMMSGIFGKFAGNLPYGVVLGLLFSLVECYFILPHHIAAWVKKGTLDRKHTTKNKSARSLTQRVWDDRVVPTYARIVQKILKRRYWVAGGSIALFVFSLGLAGLMRLELFPSDGIEIFFVRAETPVGTSLERTAALVKPIEEVVATIPDEELDTFTTQVGIQQQDPNDPNSRRGGHFAQVVVYLTPATERDRISKEIIAEIREKIGKPPGLLKVSYDSVNAGPPVGKPVDIGIRGKSFEKLLPIANELKARVSEIKGIMDLDLSYVDGKEELHVDIDPAETAAAGLSVAQVGTAVRAAYEGIVATSIRTLDEDIDVRVSYSKDYRTGKEALNDLLIRNPVNALVPLGQVATFSKSKGVASIEHEGNQRQVRVFGNVDNVEMSATKAKQVVSADILPEFKEKYPNVTFYFGGENEDTEESLISLRNAFGIAIMTIYILLLWTFNSFLTPFIILVTVPLGIISVIWTFFFHAMPISFFAMLGTIALAGVIVNNAIVFVVFVRDQRALGADRFQSIVEAGRMRIRPIFLTTVTTVAGLLPTAYGIGGYDPFVVPVVLSLGWGMFVGSFLTSFIFPAAIAIFDDLEILSFKIKGVFIQSCRDGTEPAPFQARPTKRVSR